MSSVRSLSGMFLPPPTVFDGRGEIDEPLMEQLIDWYLDVGVDGFFCFGSFGQGPALRADQRKRGAELIIRRVQHRVPVVVQIGAVDPYTSIELGIHARESGAEGVAMVGPYYYSDRSEYELIEHFKMVDAAVNLPMLLYDNPAYSGYSISPALMRKLVEAVPNIFGVKIAKGNIPAAQEYSKVTPAGFACFIPSENLMPGMLVGVRGTISPPLAVVPEIGVALVAALRRRDIPKAVELQVQVLQFQEHFHALMQSFGRSAFTAGLRLRGFPVKQYPRWPAKPLSPADEDAVRDLFSRLGVEIAGAKRPVGA